MEIFRVVTSVSLLMNIEPFDEPFRGDPGMPDPFEQVPLKDAQDSLRDFLSLSLVSRQWRRASRNGLSKLIIVRSNNARSMRAALESDSFRASSVKHLMLILGEQV
jgi:hypothetical protein